MFTAGSAEDAVRLAEAERPDVLVTDIGMPMRTATRLLERVRALGSDRGGKVPAVALTAFARSKDRTRALLGGFTVHVSKPVEADLADFRYGCCSLAAEPPTGQRRPSLLDNIPDAVKVFGSSPPGAYSGRSVMRVIKNLSR